MTTEDLEVLTWSSASANVKRKAAKKGVTNKKPTAAKAAIVSLLARGVHIDNNDIYRE